MPYFNITLQMSMAGLSLICFPSKAGMIHSIALNGKKKKKKRKKKIVVAILRVK